MWSGEGHRLLIRMWLKLWEKEDPKARAQISISLFNRFSFIKVTPCNSQKHFLQSCNRYTITFNAKIIFILANAVSELETDLPIQLSISLNILPKADEDDRGSLKEISVPTWKTINSYITQYRTHKYFQTAFFTRTTTWIMNSKLWVTSILSMIILQLFTLFCWYKIELYYRNFIFNMFSGQRKTITVRIFLLYPKSEHLKILLKNQFYAVNKHITLFMQNISYIFFYFFPPCLLYM